MEGAAAAEAGENGRGEDKPPATRDHQGPGGEGGVGVGVGGHPQVRILKSQLAADFF